jgi:hypothetical protein
MPSDHQQLQRERAMIAPLLPLLTPCVKATYREIGAALGLSTQRAEQICLHALWKVLYRARSDKGNP